MIDSAASFVFTQRRIHLKWGKSLRNPGLPLHTDKAAAAPRRTCPPAMRALSPLRSPHLRLPLPPHPSRNWGAPPRAARAPGQVLVVLRRRRPQRSRHAAAPPHRPPRAAEAAPHTREPDFHLPPPRSAALLWFLPPPLRCCCRSPLSDGGESSAAASGTCRSGHAIFFSEQLRYQASARVHPLRLRSRQLSATRSDELRRRRERTIRLHPLGGTQLWRVKWRGRISKTPSWVEAWSQGAEDEK